MIFSSYVLDIRLVAIREANVEAGKLDVGLVPALYKGLDGRLINVLLITAVKRLVKLLTKSSAELELELELLELLDVGEDAGVLCLILDLIAIRLEQPSDKT